MKIVVAFMVLLSVAAASAQEEKKVTENARRLRIFNTDNPVGGTVTAPVRVVAPVAGKGKPKQR